MLIVKTKAVSFWYVAVGYDIYKAYLCYFSVLDSPHLLVLMISICEFKYTVPKVCIDKDRNCIVILQLLNES